MDIERYGIILNTENYDECVAFYRELFGLPLMFEKVDGDFRLTCLALGTAYLMIETEGVAKREGKSVEESATKLRLNVKDIQTALDNVRAYDANASIVEHAWGLVINIVDPDGNHVSIRDEAGFIEQLHSKNICEDYTNLA
ncbi:VOC family protein [Zooshikella ganghwensis]|uniref:Glyoxalase/bleomycin resistance/dioxygenase family protein n=1 Tax=Zooshikella ganghwensis TaxID=202772 RepID=A0A4P9VMZ9_9GAMM|nr:VOC family protein [Zooshikella ganghwensis]RDH44753.1 glyoxalase/bleomycin resistance/dioxygenase family protein [Zooshikella ganghwensis]